MTRLVPIVLRPWVLPLVVLALVGPSVAAFAFVGPHLGLAVGALTATAVIVLAARARFDEEIEVAPAPDRRYRVLIVASEPLEDPAVIEELGAIASAGERGAEPGAAAELRLVAPARASRLDRWASDIEAARAHAQRTVAVSLGGLAAAGLDAGGRVGDGDAVQAVEDELRAFAAAEVVLIDGPGVGPREVEEIRRRLDRPVRELGPPSGEAARIGH